MNGNPYLIQLVTAGRGPRATAQVHTPQTAPVPPIAKGSLAANMRKLVGAETPAATAFQSRPGSLAANMRRMVAQENGR